MELLNKSSNEVNSVVLSVIVDCFLTKFFSSHSGQRVEIIITKKESTKGNHVPARFAFGCRLGFLISARHTLSTFETDCSTVSRFDRL